MRIGSAQSNMPRTAAHLHKGLDILYHSRKTGVEMRLLFRMTVLMLLLALIALMAASQVLADCEGVCSAESQLTGLSHPPAWALGKLIHFEPESASAAAAESVSLSGSPTASVPGIGPHSNEELLLKSGNVQHSPKIYIIFWGNNFENTQAGIETYAMLLKLYEGLTGSSWQGILTQYFDKTGRVGGTVSLVARYIDKSIPAPKNCATNLK